MAYPRRARYFVLDQLSRSNESALPSLPFAGHLDLISVRGCIADTVPDTPSL